MHPPANRRSATPPPRDGDSKVRLQADDASTLAALYDRHADEIYSLAMRITGEPADAEATVRGVFAAAWTEAGRHPGRQPPGTHWLLSMARIRAIDHVRATDGPDQGAPSDASRTDAARAGGAGAKTRAGDVATLHLPDPADARVTDGILTEEASRLRAAFRALPPLERLAIELAYFEGLTISQIATRIEQSPDAANARIRTGLGRLAGHIAASQRPAEPPADAPPARDLAGLYALGALNASDRAAFDAHLEVHRDSVDEVLSLLPVTRRLSSVAPPHEPPAGLRARVIETVTGAPLPSVVEEGAPESAGPEDAGLANIAGSPEPVADAGASEDGYGDPDDGARAPEPDDDGHERVADGDESPVAKAAPGAPAPLVERPAPPAPTLPERELTPAMPKPTVDAKKERGRRGLLSLAAGSLVVAVGLGGFAARQSNLATALQENLDAANTQARIAELETVAAQQVADGLREGARVLTAADVQPLDLDGQPVAPGARGRLFWSASEGGLLTATGLPPAPPGRVYRVWLIRDATPVNVAGLTADAAGSVIAPVAVPEGMTEPVPAAVTLEPAGDVTTPSGDVYLLGRP